MTNFSSWPPQLQLPSCLLMKFKVFVGNGVKFGIVVREACPEMRKAEEEKTHSVYREKSLDWKEFFSKATSFLGYPEGSHVQGRLKWGRTSFSRWSLSGMEFQMW